MINVFSIIIGFVLYTQVMFVIALLKPISEPYLIRDFYCKAVNYFNESSEFLIFSTICLIGNTLLEISFNRLYYYSMLRTSQDIEKGLIEEFRFSQISMSFTCFMMALYLLVTIERIFELLTKIARLLEFELMCRHAILTKEEEANVRNATVVQANFHDLKIDLKKQCKLMANHELLYYFDYAGCEGGNFCY